MRAVVYPLGFVLDSGIAPGKAPKERRDYVAKRGEIRGFSYHSRRRLGELIASLDWSRLFEDGYSVYWATSTYGLDFYMEHRREEGLIKQDLNALHVYMKRWVDGYRAAIWKLEFTRRGVPHYHFLIAADTRNLKGFREEFKRAWVGAVFRSGLKDTAKVDFDKMEKASTNVERVLRDNLGHVLLQYVAKYTFKGWGKGDHVWTGRFWGVFNRSFWKGYQRALDVRLSRKEFAELRRLVRRLVGDPRGTFGLKGGFWFLMEEDAVRLLSALPSIMEGKEEVG